MDKINLIGFLCEACGQNKKIYVNIDMIYKKRKYEFYKLSRESDWYNHPLITGGSLIQEEYSKKTLGILLYISGAPNDTEIASDIFNMFKSGWAYAFTHLNLPKISLSTFMQRFIKKNGGLENVTDDDINANLIILIAMSLITGKTIIEDDFYHHIFQCFSERLEHYESNNRINITQLSHDDKENMIAIKSMIFNKVGKITDFMTLLDCLSGDMLNEQVSFLFDYENLSSSIFHCVEFTSKDVDEIIFLYYTYHKDLDKIDVDDAVKFYLYSLYIKYLIKCYKQVKAHYFENNKETQFAELEAKEKEVIKLSSMLEQKETTEMNLINRINELTKKVERMSVELENEAHKNKELNSLREFVFRLDSQVSYKETDIDYSRLKQLNAVIIGGHERWQAKMKESLPKCTFIHTDMNNFDVNILNSVNDVFFYVNYLNHPIYYKVINYIRGKNKKIHYLNQQNEKLILMEMQKVLLSSNTDNNSNLLCS
nr:hypothetical protein [uncultured Anaerosporobacter sp.]